MMSIFDVLFNTDRYASDARREQARLVYLLCGLIIVASFILIFVLPIGSQEGKSHFASALITGNRTVPVAGLFLVFGPLFSVIFVRFGYYNQGAVLVNLITTSSLTLVSSTNGFSEDSSYIALCFTVILSALTLQEIGLVVVAGYGLLLYILSFTYFDPLENAVGVTVVGLGFYISLATMCYAFIRYSRASQSEIQLLESAERLKLVDITTNITRLASQRVSLPEVLDTTLGVILENFQQFYHAQVFLIDESGVHARLTASTGETGRQLLERAHSLAVGSLSVIGQCTLKGESVMAFSGGEGSVHRENVLLRATQLEAAFPLRIGDRIIGALDLQSSYRVPLSDADLISFQSIADSLSLAVDNIRQFELAQTRIEENERLAEQSRTSLREIERLNQRLIGRAWSEYLSDREAELGFDIDLQQNVSQPAGEWTPALDDAAQSNVIVQKDNLIAVPLRVRGVVVGAMEFELEENAEVDPAQLELVKEVSERFGLAAENTRLVEESQRLAQRETLINEISARLQSANYIEATLTEAARSLLATLRADKVSIRLGRPEGNGTGG